MACTYSYKNRSPTENSSSGLDDYPRGYTVNKDYEIHLDLQTWILELTNLLVSLAELQKMPHHI
jgi:hypothetical protein